MNSKQIASGVPEKTSRREFVRNAAGAAALAVTGVGLAASRVHAGSDRKIRVGIIGCGSVSWKYIPELQSKSYFEIVSACDIIPSRAEARAEDYRIPHVYSHIDQMLAGAEFDFLVNLTSMPSHYKVNKRALQAGKHVWSEKPLADTVSQGQELIELAGEKKVGFWAAPCTVTSPQFRFMAETIAQGKLGRLCAARAIYGHNGAFWLWAPEFFQKGGGSLYDLGVYNITTLTGLLGPAKRIAGMWSIVHPEVTVKTHEGEKVRVKVETDENAMLIMDHGNGVFSHVQTGFSYFDRAKPHDFMGDDLHSIEIIGDAGTMSLAGYDWGPVAVDLATEDQPQTQRYCTDSKEYKWQHGASYIGECMLTGRQSLITAEHALHVLEVIQACRDSCNTGRYVDIQTTFKWPIIAG
jgi:predicted dehydrogenase